MNRGASNMNNWRQWAARLAGAGMIAWVACAAADAPVRESRNLAQPFNEVRLLGGFDLELVQSDTTSLAIEAAPENLREIRSDVEGGVLTVRWEDGGPLHWFRWFSRHPAARVFLSVKAIDKLGLDGSGSVHAATWTHHALELRISGSGNATFDHLTTARLISHIAGSGNIVAAGAAANQEVHISGSGRYRAGDLKSQTATVSISGSGDVQLWVERTLEVRIAGSGDVRYYGAPAVTQSVSGSGSVTGLGAKSAP
jgi:Putative auto-transporter adhesin, head GIN domain